MNVKSVYQCTKCNKTYNTYKEAELCCNDNTYINSLLESVKHLIKTTTESTPKVLNNIEDYVRTIDNIKQLEKASMSLAKVGYDYNDIDVLKNKLLTLCNYFINNVTESMITEIDSKHSDIFNKTIIIDDRVYTVNSFEDFLENYFHGSMSMYLRLSDVNLTSS